MWLRVLHIRGLRKHQLWWRHSNGKGLASVNLIRCKQHLEVGSVKPNTLQTAVMLPNRNPIQQWHTEASATCCNPHKGQSHCCFSLYTAQVDVLPSSLNYKDYSLKVIVCMFISLLFKFLLFCVKYSYLFPYHVVTDNWQNNLTSWSI